MMDKLFTNYENSSLEEKLDEVLHFLAGELLYNEKLAPNAGFYIKDICQELKMQINPGDEKIIQAQLYDDGFIVPIVPQVPDVIRISPKGLKFINESGYVGLRVAEEERVYKEQLEKRVHESTIRTNRWIVFSVILSLVAVAISLIALFK